MPRIELERIEEIEDTSQSSTERFDRIAFAQHALALVRPAGTTVAVCEGRRVGVQAGRQWGAPLGQRWAILSVSRDASRRAIATAVLELSTLGASRPWALDVLIGGCESAYRGPGRP